MRIHPSAPAVGAQPIRHRFLATLTSSVYLTASSLAIANALATTNSTTFISWLAQSQPVPVGDATLYRIAAESAGLPKAALDALMALTFEQDRARHELEFPSPRPWFSRSHSEHQRLVDLWVSAARHAKDLIDLADLVRDENIGLLSARFDQSYKYLTVALQGVLPEDLANPMATLPSWVQRRQHRRVKTSRPVNIWIRDRRLQGKVLDVSQGGAMIEAYAQVQRGESILIEFPSSPMRKAIIRWSIAPRFGISFIDPLFDDDPLLSAHQTARDEQA